MSFTLICLILGDNHDRTFTIEIEKTKSVDILKKLIKVEMSPHFDHIAASNLDLWKVFIPIDNLETDLGNLSLVQYPKLSPPSKKLTKFFEDVDVVDDYLHVVVKVPEEVQPVVALNTSQLLSLNCLILGNDPDQIFTVEIPGTKNVSILKDLIKEKKSHHLKDVDAADLQLWKALIPYDDHAALQKFTPIEDKAKPLLPMLDLSEIFPTHPTKRQIHIIVQHTPQLSDINDQTGGEDEGHDKLTAIIKFTRQRYQRSLKKNLESPSPSLSAKSSGYAKFQKDGEPIYDGRYVAASPAETRAPPIELYYPDFGRFSDDLANENLEVPGHVLEATARLMEKVSGIYANEKLRKMEIQPALSNVLLTDVHLQTIVNFDSTSPDGVVVAQAPFGEIAVALVEEIKNEVGDGASDPSTQAGLSFSRYWAQPDYEKIREHSCCPTFLVGIAGPSIAILGAIWTDKVIVQRLTDYIWLGHDKVLNDKAIHRNAHILYTLSKYVQRLIKYYRFLKPQPKLVLKKLEVRYLPSIDRYLGPENRIIKFTLIVPLEEDSVCTTFLGQTEGPGSQTIVVKFVQRYNKEAHELLAGKGMAPKLRYYGKVGVCSDDPSYGDLRMVVMDYVDGATTVKTTLPPTLLDQVEGILGVLHENDYVFGDLRRPNVMITKNEDVMLIDFDWVGKHGESKYPMIMSPSIQWPEGVKGGSVMMKEHDIDMLKRFI